VAVISRSALHYVWALPNSVVSFPIIAVGLLLGSKARVVDGVLEVWGGALSFLLARVPIRGGALAMTLGHVVLGRSAQAMEMTRAHERVHVRQCERWGPFFIPAYFLAGLVAILRGGNGYRDNRFEREAFSTVETMRR
jgi:hypothetical protein